MCVRGEAVTEMVLGGPELGRNVFSGGGHTGMFWKAVRGPLSCNIWTLCLFRPQTLNLSLDGGGETRSC